MSIRTPEAPGPSGTFAALDRHPTGERSPFGAIRRTRDDGAEYWSARELMPLLGYDQLHAPAAAWGSLAGTRGDYAVADAAKVLSRDPNVTIGRDRLFNFMHCQSWIYRERGHWRAYQAQVDNGRLCEKVTKPYFNEALQRMVLPEPTIRITVKGLGELLKRLGGGVQPALVAGA